MFYENYTSHLSELHFETCRLAENFWRMYAAFDLIANK